MECKFEWFVYVYICIWSQNLMMAEVSRLLQPARLQKYPFGSLGSVPHPSEPAYRTSKVESMTLRGCTGEETLSKVRKNSLE